MDPEIEAAAQNFVASIRTIYEHRSEYCLVDASEWEPDHRRGYDQIARELAKEGWSALGDYEDLAHTRMFPSLRSFSRFGRSDDAVVVGTWFAARFPPGQEPPPARRRCLVLRTWLADGRAVMTVRGGADNGSPTPPGQIVQRLDDGVATAEVLRQHRKKVSAAGGTPQRAGSIEEILGQMLADERATAEFRESLGVGLFEAILRKLTGADFETQGQPILDAILAHPEWLTGVEERPIKSFFCSEDEQGRRHITTLGLTLLGLPELQMKGLAANHMRAARLLLNTVARKLAARGSAGEDFELSLAAGDVAADEPYRVEGEPAAAGSGKVRLVLEGFDADDEPGLLSLRPPNGTPPDEWLPLVCRALGQDAPRALPASAMQEAMRAASERARAHLGTVARRFRETRAPLAIKTGLPTTAGGMEYVWVTIRDWRPDGVLVGDLVSQPQDCPDYQAGQEMQLREPEVFDYAMEDDAVQLPRTEIVAQEFGLDL
ncbi:MAG TPA: hypothetical protein VN914_02280 [Polyangia bacterium]|nr:hypothetical protein [Polyangia bacterium]